MKLSNIKLLLFICFILIFNLTTLAQDTLKAENFNDYQFQTGKKYVLTDIINVQNILRIDRGATLEFKSGAAIICHGRIRAIGSNTERIKFIGESIKSGSNDLAGIGFIITNENNEDVVFNFCDFINLASPLKFDYSFFRKRVDVSFCTFKDNFNNSNFIVVSAPQISIGDDSSYCNFTFSRNVFNNNSGGIFFEDFRSNNMQINIESNVFLGNEIPNFGKFYNYDENVLYGRADKYWEKFNARINNNSFRNNFMVDQETQEFVQFVNLGVYGSADSIVISDNYFDAELYKSTLPFIYDYTTSYIAPRLRIVNPRQIPAQNIPSHVYKSNSRQPGNPEEKLPFNVDLHKGLQQVTLFTNSPVQEKNNSFRVKYVYERDTSQKIADTSIDIRPQITNQGTQIQVTIPDFHDSILFKKDGYIVISGLFDREGQEIPEEIIGYKYYLTYSAITREIRKKKRILNPEDSIINKPKITPPLPPYFYKKAFEIGLNIERTSYLGTISAANFLANYNYSFGLDFLIALKYNVSVGLNVLFGNISHGPGNTETTNPNNPTGLYFNTPILGFGLRIEKNFFNNRYYKYQFRTPQISMFSGFEFISFKPQAESPTISGLTYDLNELRNPTDTSFIPFPTSTFAVPLGIKIRWQINPKFSVASYISYHFTFTDYLDGVSDETFPENYAPNFKYNEYLRSKGFTTINQITDVYNVINPNGIPNNFPRPRADGTVENYIPQRANKSASNDSFLSFGVGIYFHL